MNNVLEKIITNYQGVEYIGEINCYHFILNDNEFAKVFIENNEPISAVYSKEKKCMYITFLPRYEEKEFMSWLKLIMT